MLIVTTSVSQWAEITRRALGLRFCFFTIPRVREGVIVKERESDREREREGSVSIKVVQRRRQIEKRETERQRQKNRDRERERDRERDLTDFRNEKAEREEDRKKNTFQEVGIFAVLIQRGEATTLHVHRRTSSMGEKEDRLTSSVGRGRVSFRHGDRCCCIGGEVDSDGRDGVLRKDEMEKC